jgi:hypothetical protein
VAGPRDPPLRAEREERLLARWSAAERQIYPLALAAPDVYLRHVALVRAVADELHSLTRAPELFDAHTAAAALAARVAERNGVPAADVSLDHVAGAAFALRYREVVALERLEEVERLVRSAKQRGEEWVVILEEGPEEDSPAPPYERVLMHLPDGAGLRVFVELDADMASPRYGIEALQLDPRTGRPVPGRAPPASPRTFADAGAWRAAAESMQRLYSGPPSG